MAPGVLNSGFLQPYGRITDFKLNSESRELDVTVELNGEVEPLRVHIEEYELIEEAGKIFLIVHRVVTSRTWLTALATKSRCRTESRIARERREADCAVSLSKNSTGLRTPP
jgi:hypothetical protein